VNVPPSQRCTQFHFIWGKRASGSGGKRTPLSFCRGEILPPELKGGCKPMLETIRRCGVSVGSVRTFRSDGYEKYPAVLPTCATKPAYGRQEELKRADGVPPRDTARYPKKNSGFTPAAKDHDGRQAEGQERPGRGLGNGGNVEIDTACIVNQVSRCAVEEVHTQPAADPGVRRA